MKINKTSIKNLAEERARTAQDTMRMYVESKALEQYAKEVQEILYDSVLRIVESGVKNYDGASLVLKTSKKYDFSKDSEHLRLRKNVETAKALLTAYEKIAKESMQYEEEKTFSVTLPD